MRPVLVFAPAPQLTVTIEQAHDAPELHVHAGALKAGLAVLSGPAHPSVVQPSGAERPDHLAQPASGF